MNPVDTSHCHCAEILTATKLSRPRQLVLLSRFFSSLQTRGLRGTARKLVSYFGSRSRARSTSASPGPSDVLHLQPGELVQVRSAQEIAATLDANNRHRGLTFLPEMLPFCGNQYRVRKRLERLFLEESKQVRKIQNTVLLDGVMCDGKALGCDRSCFLYWREAWLRRVDDKGASD